MQTRSMVAETVLNDNMGALYLLQANRDSRTARWDIGQDQAAQFDVALADDGARAVWRTRVADLAEAPDDRRPSAGGCVRRGCADLQS
jgi:hypothetical protein